MKSTSGGKNTFYLSTLAAAILINVAILGCNRQTENHQQNNHEQDTVATDTVQKQNPYANADIEVKVFKNDTGKYTGFGYDILVNQKPFIRQPNIPAMPGNAGFSSEEKAKRAGEFVVSKIRSASGMPRVEPKELDSIGVLK